MSFLKLFPHYLLWHYTKAFADLWRVSKNLLFSISHFFAFTLLLRSLFSPWERLGETHRKGSGIGDYFATLVVNFIMRIIGFVMRFVLLVVGSLVYVLACVGICLSFVVWPFLPLIVVILLIDGTSNLIA